MAGLGFKDFAVGEVLTSADVDGYLMQQTVMRFADSAARGSALGTAAGTGVALAEGMVSYLDDVNGVQVYTGSSWVGVGSFSAATAITATDASWSVPALGDPIVRVTVVGGGGSGGSFGTDGNAGGSSSFACSAGTATALGGLIGRRANVNMSPAATRDGWSAGNGGRGSSNGTNSALEGTGGAVTVAYFDLTGVTTANVTVGAGGVGPTSNPPAGADGGDGVVIVEYRAG